MTSKILGAGSFFCSSCIILLTIAGSVTTAFVYPNGQFPGPLRPVIAGAWALGTAAILGTWFFIIYDVAHAATNPRLSRTAKAGWICAICSLSVFVIPLYWMKYQRE